MEHHKKHRRKNRDINQFCLGPISKYWEISYRCIARHYPVWAGFRFRVRRYSSLHISITVDGVRAHSCLIFKWRVWPENNICWKSLIICYWNTIRGNHSREITHKCLSCRITWEYRHIYVRVAGVLAARFSNLTTFELSHRRDVVTYIGDIFYNKCKRPHHVTWKISNLYIENKYHYLTSQKKFRLLLNKGVHCCEGNDSVFIGVLSYYFVIVWRRFFIKKVNWNP